MAHLQPATSQPPSDFPKMNVKLLVPPQAQSLPCTPHLHRGDLPVPHCLCHRGGLGTLGESLQFSQPPFHQPCH